MGKTELKPKARRGCAPASLEKNTDVQGQQVAAVIQHSFQWWSYPAVHTDEEAADRLNEFFRVCMANQELPTVEKMCLCLGVDRNTVLTWEHGKLGPTRMGIIKKAKEILASIDAELVATGHMNTVAYIFRAKNFYGMRDQQDIVVTPAMTQPDATPEELSAKYLEGVLLSVEDAEENTGESPH